MYMYICLHVDITTLLIPVPFFTSNQHKSRFSTCNNAEVSKAVEGIGTATCERIGRCHEAGVEDGFAG